MLSSFTSSWRLFLVVTILKIPGLSSCPSLYFWDDCPIWGETNQENLRLLPLPVYLALGPIVLLRKDTTVANSSYRVQLRYFSLVWNSWLKRWLLKSSLKELNSILWRSSITEVLPNTSYSESAHTHIRALHSRAWLTHSHITHLHSRALLTHMCTSQLYTIGLADTCTYHVFILQDLVDKP